MSHIYLIFLLCYLNLSFLLFKTTFKNRICLVFYFLIVIVKIVIVDNNYNISNINTIYTSNIYTSSSVGINTNITPRTLTVAGDIFLTGNIYQGTENNLFSINFDAGPNSSEMVLDKPFDLEESVSIKCDLFKLY